MEVEGLAMGDDGKMVKVEVPEMELYDNDEVFER